MSMLPNESLVGILTAAVIALIAALLFPAETQSKLWVKVFGSEWGTSAKGRVWTFLAVLIVVALLYGLLRWLPTNP